MSSRLIRPAQCAIDDSVTTQSVSLGGSRLVSATWPKWLVPIWLSKPSLVSANGAAMMPALLISRAAAVDTVGELVHRRQALQIQPAHLDVTAHLCGGGLTLGGVRTARITVAPLLDDSRAVIAPRPLLAPVTITVHPANDGRSAAVQSVMLDHPSDGNLAIARDVRAAAAKPPATTTTTPSPGCPLLAPPLFGGDDEAVNDHVDVGSLRRRLVG